MFKSILGKLLLGLLIVGGIYGFLMWPLPGAKARVALGSPIKIHSEVGGLYVQAYINSPMTKKIGRVILVPSAGREASDFNELVTTLSSQGFETIAIDGHGINGPFVPEFTDLAQVSEPVIAMLKADKTPTILIGHAYGNRVVRAAAAQQPKSVKAVILLAAGGYNEVDPETDKHLKSAFNPVIIALKREGHIRQGLFAEVNYPKPLNHWKRGWHMKTAIMQGNAKVSETLPNWEAAGGVPILVLQPAEDRVAPKAETADLIKARYPNQVTVTVIENAGHALLPEQPEAVAKAVSRFLHLHLSE